MLVRVTFDTGLSDSLSEDDRWELVNAVEAYVGSLRKYGHIHRGYSDGWRAGSLDYYVNPTAENALVTSSYSEPVQRDLERLYELFKIAPEFTEPGKSDSVATTDWQSSKSLYLFTHAFANGNAVKCGDTGKPVPAYALPIPTGLREAIYFWESEYRAFDRIWIASGALEMEAYRQVAEPTSKLSETGRDICSQVEASTNTPTFYYLMRYYGRTEESSRPCPICGGDWRTGEASDSTEFHEFYFRCEPCRVVANLCSTVEEDEENAEIGEQAR